MIPLGPWRRPKIAGPRMRWEDPCHSLAGMRRREARSHWKPRAFADKILGESDMVRECHVDLAPAQCCNLGLGTAEVERHKADPSQRGLIISALSPPTASPEGFGQPVPPHAIRRASRALRAIIERRTEILYDMLLYVVYNILLLLSLGIDRGVAVVPPRSLHPSPGCVAGELLVRVTSTRASGIAPLARSCRQRDAVRQRVSPYSLLHHRNPSTIEKNLHDFAYSTNTAATSASTTSNTCASASMMRTRSSCVTPPPPPPPERGGSHR